MEDRSISSKKRNSKIKNPCHKAFTLFDYKKAANKKKLAQSLNCKDAKQLSLFLHVLYSFMRRVASVFSRGGGSKTKLWTAWLRYIIFILYCDRFRTKFYKIISRQLKTNPSLRNSCQVYEDRVTCLNQSTDIISHHMHHCICFTIMFITAVVSASKLFVFCKASAAFGAAKAHLQLRPLRRATNTSQKE